MGVLQYQFSDLYKDAVSRYLYATGTPDATQTVECKRITNDGYREFLSAHDWTFLSPAAAITLWTTMTGAASGAPVKDNGTSTVTSAAAMFYSSMVGRSVAFTAGSSYVIASYTSSTVVVVTGDASGEADADVLTVTATGDYGLPAGFASILDRPTFDDEIAYAALKDVTPEYIRQKRTQEADPMSDPSMYAIQPREYTILTGQRWDMLVWPTPNTTRVMNYRYMLDPDEMTADAEYPVGGPAHGPTIRVATLMVAERDKGIVDGHYGKLYREYFLPLSISRDRDLRPRNLGYCGDSSDDLEPGVPMPEMGTYTQ